MLPETRDAWSVRDDFPGYGEEVEREIRDVRILMLCFMAAMVEAGDA